MNSIEKRKLTILRKRENKRILELKQLTTIPQKEKNNEMPHLQVFKPNHLL